MSLYVADTHAIVWWFAGHPRKVGARARRVFKRFVARADELSVSVITLWEISMLHEAGKLKLTAGYAAFVDAIVRMGARIEPLTQDDIQEARSLPGLVDPHDRLIAGLALRLKAPLLTADERISRERRVRVVWD